MNAASSVYEDTALTVAVASRENDGSAVAHSGIVNTYGQGGLDNLYREKTRMTFLPTAVTSRWKAATPFTNPETGNIVYPALIPAQDQLIAYAAQLRISEDRFIDMVNAHFGEDRGRELLGSLSKDAKRAWVLLTFARPGRAVGFNPEGARSSSRAGRRGRTDC